MLTLFLPKLDKLKPFEHFSNFATCEVLNYLVKWSIMEGTELNIVFGFQPLPFSLTIFLK